ncbi:MAG: 16S rRNA (adenine(1518)-N(6)/adenine(1519)-N(6))-dimethyltransferase RsmA [Endomicrobium sp.]|jgi:16S rRNA (adenine1518-N6/adenine1519-N6)-dimethyltransferase|nr:16S rRNA (adenine(1518)-N(6)/adenine(1519)-N(6))-dimethyltransferase RsmA [Endomicrobium sp.]
MWQKYGQIFLIDNNISAKIVKATDLDLMDNILEIGPGRGILTKLMVSSVNFLTAIEIDKTLFQQLSDYFFLNKITNIELINQDFLRYNIPDIKRKFVSNLPYSVGTAIIQKILPLRNWTTAVFMLQKEVVERLVAKPGNKCYGYISAFTSYYADTEVLFDVSPKCFNPVPKVTSSVIRFKNKKANVPEPALFEFVKHTFSMRRKTILNCVSSFCDIPKDMVSDILKSCGLNAFLRPDSLSILDFLNLTKEIKNYRIYRAGF